MWVKVRCSLLLRDQSTALDLRPILAPSIVSRTLPEVLTHEDLHKWRHRACFYLVHTITFR